MGDAKVRDVTVTFTVDNDIMFEDLYESLGLSLGWPKFVRGVRLDHTTEHGRQLAAVDVSDEELAPVAHVADENDIPIPESMP